MPIQLGPTGPRASLWRCAAEHHRVDDARLVWPVAPTSGIGTTTPGAKLAIGGTAGTDGIMFPDGTLQTTKAAANYQVFTASGTWTKPSWATGNEMVVVQVWGAGGGGSNTAGGPGGGGGAYNTGVFKASNLAATVSVTVGTSAAATAGGSSSFNGLIAYGGGGSTATYSCGGGGSGCLGTYGGNSTYGGGGGAPSAGQGGSSVFAGTGGSPGTSPTTPSGGGGPQQAGARGEVRVWVIP